MNVKELADVVLDLGEKMVYCGAEIYRVEDTVTRICNAYNTDKTEVFVIPSVIIVTLKSENNPPYTQIRRLTKNHEIDLNYLSELNAFSRRICASVPPVEELKNMLDAIEVRKYPKLLKCFTHAVISASFSMYVGGNAQEATVSACIGIILAVASGFFAKIKVNANFISFCSALLCGLTAALVTKIFPVLSVDNIVIGNIMILVPGLALTNSIRDMINGDIVSGLISLSRSVFTAVALAAGFAVSLLVLGI